MRTFWRIAAASSGLAAVGAFVFLSLFKSWLGLGIFAPLSETHPFILMLALLALAWLALVAMLTTYVILRRRNGNGNGRAVERGKGGERYGGMGAFRSSEP